MEIIHSYDMTGSDQMVSMLVYRFLKEQRDECLKYFVVQRLFSREILECHHIFSS